MSTLFQDLKCRLNDEEIRTFANLEEAADIIKELQNENLDEDVQEVVCNNLIGLLKLAPLQENVINHAVRWIGTQHRQEDGERIRKNTKPIPPYHGTRVLLKLLNSGDLDGKNYNLAYVAAELSTSFGTVGDPLLLTQMADALCDLIVKDRLPPPDFKISHFYSGEKESVKEIIQNHLHNFIELGLKDDEITDYYGPLPLSGKEKKSSPDERQKLKDVFNSFAEKINNPKMNADQETLAIVAAAQNYIETLHESLVMSIQRRAEAQNAQETLYKARKHVFGYE